MEPKENKWTSICYVAGPYRAASEYLIKKNIRAAEDVGVLLWYYGFISIVPHLNTQFFGGAYGLPDEVWLKGDFEILKRCDFVVAITGWRYSPGTLKEIECAKQNGIHVYNWEDPNDQYFLSHYYEEE